MPGKCPKCGGRLFKRTGKSKTSGKQYNYYCCEHWSSKEDMGKCSFVTWDVPVKDNCPVCGDTMFKKGGRGAKKPFCINEGCSNFLPEDKRGGWKKPESSGQTGEEEKQTKKPAAKKSTGKKRAAKKTTAKKPAAKKPAAKTGKKTAEKTEE